MLILSANHSLKSVFKSIIWSKKNNNLKKYVTLHPKSISCGETDRGTYVDFIGSSENKIGNKCMTENEANFSEMSLLDFVKFCDSAIYNNR